MYTHYKAVSFRTYINLLEAIIHGIAIFFSIYFTLPQVRLKDGRILPIQAFHLAIFIVLISVSNLKKVFNPVFKSKFLIAGTLLTYVVISLCVLSGSLLNENFKKIGQQFVILFSNYDSLVIMINTTIFCLAVSLFLD